jgi:hypothetical protein
MPTRRPPYPPEFRLEAVRTRRSVFPDTGAFDGCLAGPVE